MMRRVRQRRYRRRTMLLNSEVPFSCIRTARMITYLGMEHNTGLDYSGNDSYAILAVVNDTNRIYNWMVTHYANQGDRRAAKVLCGSFWLSGTIEIPAYSKHGDADSHSAAPFEYEIYSTLVKDDVLTSDIDPTIAVNTNIAGSFHNLVNQGFADNNMITAVTAPNRRPNLKQNLFLNQLGYTRMLRRGRLLPGRVIPIRLSSKRRRIIQLEEVDGAALYLKRGFSRIIWIRYRGVITNNSTLDKPASVSYSKPLFTWEYQCRHYLKKTQEVPIPYDDSDSYLTAGIKPTIPGSNLSSGYWEYGNGDPRQTANLPPVVQ